MRINKQKVSQTTARAEICDIEVCKRLDYVKFSRLHYYTEYKIYLLCDFLVLVLPSKYAIIPTAIIIIIPKR